MNILYLTIVTRLQGNALVEFNQNKNRPSDWLSLRKYLVSRYQSKETFFQLLAKLSLLTQSNSETIREYALRIQSISTEALNKGLEEGTPFEVLKPMIDLLGTQRLKNHCKMEIATLLVPIPHTLNFEEILTIASSYETNLINIRTRQARTEKILFVLPSKFS